MAKKNLTATQRRQRRIRKAFRKPILGSFTATFTESYDVRVTDQLRGWLENIQERSEGMH